MYNNSRRPDSPKIHFDFGKKESRKTTTRNMKEQFQGRDHEVINFFRELGKTFSGLFTIKQLQPVLAQYEQAMATASPSDLRMAYQQISLFDSHRSRTTRNLPKNNHRPTSIYDLPTGSQGESILFDLNLPPKVLAILVSLFLLLTLAACTVTPNVDATSSPTQTSSEISPTPTTGIDILPSPPVRPTQIPTEESPITVPTDTGEPESTGGNPEEPAPTPAATQEHIDAVQAKFPGLVIPLTDMHQATDDVYYAISEGIIYISTAMPDGTIDVDSFEGDEVENDQATHTLKLKKNGTVVATFDTNQSELESGNPTLTPVVNPTPDDGTEEPGTQVPPETLPAPQDIPEIVNFKPNYPLEYSGGTMGTQFAFYKWLEYGRYIPEATTQAAQEIILSDGTHTGYWIELGADAYNTPGHTNLGLQNTILPIQVFNENNGTRIIGRSLMQTDLPKYSMQDFLYIFYNQFAISFQEKYSPFNTWYSDPNAHIPELNQGDLLGIQFIPSKDISLFLPTDFDPTTQEMIDERTWALWFWLPLLKQVYGEDMSGFVEYTQTGDLSKVTLPTVDGKKVLISALGVPMTKDVVDPFIAENP